MEILSIGQKIKRSRIYKGYTLKDLCNDEISVSKLSCIENDKINPEEWILKFISQKLNLDLNYLRQDVREQIIINLNELHGKKYSDVSEDELKYNLKFAIDFNYLDLVFEIVHILFNLYLESENYSKVQECISQYYDLASKQIDINKKVIYYMDFANYLYKNEEYHQAKNYYCTVNNILTVNKSEEYEFFALSKLKQAMCLLKVKEYEELFKLLDELKTNLKLIKDKKELCKMYHIIAIINLLKTKNYEEFYESETNMIEKCGNDMSILTEILFNYSELMFKLGNREKAKQYMNKAVKCFPKEDIKKLTMFYIECMKLLVNNECLENTQELCDDTLNLSIGLQDNKLIENAYFYKALIFEKQQNYEYAEMYINLSLDLLLKFGSKKAIFKRYIQIGNLYSKLNNVKESIKCFSIAINMKSNI